MNSQFFRLPLLLRTVAVFSVSISFFYSSLAFVTACADESVLAQSAIPIVLTPSQLPQRLDEAPGTVTVIDRAMIEASGARELVEVLRLVPGFYVGSKYNNLPTVGYHGFADEFSRRLLLLVDGQRVFQYSRGVIEWNNLPLPLESVERIEVIRGPNAAVYGSNAFQGVINIQTRHSDALVFNLGTMLEHADLSADNLSFLPRLSAYYHLDDHQTLRAVYSTGSRVSLRLLARFQ